MIELLLLRVQMTAAEQRCTIQTTSACMFFLFHDFFFHV